MSVKTLTPDVLEALLSMDSERRRQAEAYLQEIPVKARATQLTQLLLASHPAGKVLPVQQLAAVLLRRDILLLTQAPDLLVSIREVLLPFFGRNPDTAVAHCLAEICHVQSVTQSEEAANTSLLAVLNATASTLSLPTTLKLWIALARRAPSTFKHSALHGLPDCLSSAIRNGAPPGLVVELVVASTQTMNAVDADLLTRLATMCLVPALVSNEDSETILEHLLQAASEAPWLLECVLDCIVEYCCRAPQSLAAIQILCILPGKDIPAILQSHVAARLLQLWIDCDTDWIEDPATPQDDFFIGNDDLDFIAHLWQQVLRRVGRPALEFTFQILPTLPPHVALWALDGACQALPAAFAPYHVAAVEFAQRCCSNLTRSASSLVVVHAALILWGRTAEGGDSSLSVLQSIVACFAQSQGNTQVLAAACCAVVSYVRANPETVQSLVATQVWNALTQGPLSIPIQHAGAIEVLTRAMGAVAALAETMESDFLPFYSSAMSGFKGFLVHPELRDITLEIIAWIGQAVGADTFAPDAVPILDELVASMANRYPTIEQLVACSRMASALGEYYIPYVDKVIPSLLQRAAEEVRVELSDGIDDISTHSQHYAMEDGIQCLTAAVPGRGITKITLNTSQIQEKVTAIRGIYDHAQALGRKFGTHCATAFDILLPLVNFPYSGDVRAVTAQTLAIIFEASCEMGVASGTMGLPQGKLPVLATSISARIEQDHEPDDTENMFALADSLSSILDAVHRRIEDVNGALLDHLTIGHAQLIVQNCAKSLHSCISRRHSIMHKMANSLTEDEYQDCGQKLDAENTILIPLVDSIGYIIKLFKERFVSSFEGSLESALVPYLNCHHEDPKAQFAAICLFDDCVEHCGPAAAAKYAAPLLEAVLTCLDPKANKGDEELVRVSLYGITQIARYAPASVLMPYAQTTIEQVLRYVSMEMADGRNNVVESGIAALASLVVYEGAPLRACPYLKWDHAFEIVLRYLPLENDEDEARFCHSKICEIIDRGDIKLCSQLVRVIKDTLTLVEEGNNVATPETHTRFTAILAELQQRVPKDEMTRSCNSLSVESLRTKCFPNGESIPSASHVVTP